MTSYAVISDIHGCLSALQSIWTKLEERRLTDRTVLNAGDNVAYGLESAACIDFLQAHSQIVTVGGNYDYNVAHYPQERARFDRKWHLQRPEKLLAVRQASDQLTESQRLWLSNLPDLLEISLEGRTIALSHYSPTGGKRGLGSWSSDADLLQVALSTAYDAIVVGHTHTPFVREVGGTVFINPGSVGRAWDHPTYAVLTIDGTLIRGEVMS